MSCCRFVIPGGCGKSCYHRIFDRIFHLKQAKISKLSTRAEFGFSNYGGGGGGVISYVVALFQELSHRNIMIHVFGWMHWIIAFVLRFSQLAWSGWFRRFSKGCKGEENFFSRTISVCSMDADADDVLSPRVLTLPTRFFVALSPPTAIRLLLLTCFEFLQFLIPAIVRRFF